MYSLRFTLVLALLGSLIFLGPVGCRAFGGRKGETPSRSRVIKREPSDDSTMTGWVGGERPSF